ncbi:MAG: nitroreductase family protein, partial [Pseudohongiella sp.]|nr:nitroreductase family protein [Pseudohongiella sp.]
MSSAVNKTIDAHSVVQAASHMSLEQAILQRRSVRGYLPDLVPEAVLQNIFELAQLAPSNCNVQPWKVYVASGALRDELSTEMQRRIRDGVT